MPDPNKAPARQGPSRHGPGTMANGYDADAGVMEPLRREGKQVVIPPRSNRKYQQTYDRVLHNDRHLIASFIEKLKEYRDRIQLVDIDSLQEEVSAYARSCFEVIADLPGLHENTAEAN